MLIVARKYSEVIDDITSNKSLKLRKYELSDTQWEIVDDLIHVLEIFKNATLLFSKDSKDSESTISQVIPMMDVIDDFLVNAGPAPVTNAPSNKRNLHPAVKAAIALAKATMNHYYLFTDDSNIYWITMVLHPGLKLNYFCMRGWEQKWIDTAESITRKEFKFYDNIEVAAEPSTPVSISLLIVPFLTYGVEVCPYN
ncbi:hypothetical protein BT96DRAFT_814525 [Gymnopus androsaceus JB14]|uniref:hAT-like transposase RNase-H fold domain-containing protein n=1 Tax=Gymnopus androsaceus JB14 TaxID=1447944 RepID=A0A6A4I3I3_9AGAR|nr:hypothetical protein BT96DRAFT_814525 [Gymnopus androsaceus JB14]